MQLVDDTGTAHIECREISMEHLKTAGSRLASRIIKLLSEKPEGMHASGIAKVLHEHEQKIYYHTHRMIKAGILKVYRTEDGRGATAKVLALQYGAFAVRLRKLEPIARIVQLPARQSAYLLPFIEHGNLNCKIIVGSPDPHGPEQARSRDANYAIDLGVFLGTFLTTRAPPAVLLDTELRDWNHNLIIIGGPVVNKAAERINIKSPARYDKEAKAFVAAGKKYGQENTGIIAKMPNPFARGKWILHIAGKRHTGTRAAIVALMTEFEKICQSDLVVVEGIDEDSDGIVEKARILKS